MTITPKLRRLSSSIIQRKLNIVNAAKKSAVPSTTAITVETAKKTILFLLLAL